jgi:hypothetical protein
MAHNENMMPTGGPVEGAVKIATRPLFDPLPAVGLLPWPTRQ